MSESNIGQNDNIANKLNSDSEEVTKKRNRDEESDASSEHLQVPKRVESETIVPSTSDIVPVPEAKYTHSIMDLARIISLRSEGEFSEPSKDRNIDKSSNAPTQFEDKHHTMT